MRQAKKDYYNKRLQENKSDTWKILIDILRNNPKKPLICRVILLIRTGSDVINEFNS